jgi:hypothetical protein
MPRLSVRILAAPGLVVVAACNTLLDNEPATLVERDAAPPAPPAGDEPSRAGDASGDAGEAEPRSSCDACALPHATATCGGGACAIATCDEGFADCDADPADGCESDLSSVASCGACGVACPVPPNTAPACVAGVCVVECSAGFADCNRKRSDGCEVDLDDDDDNCGACRRRCRVGHCVEGTCKIVL